MNYEAVIGLEVHVQIKTHSKVFTRVGAGFGHEPNTLTDPVVLALPGTLPVMNKAALDAIIKAGLLLGCDIAPACKWDRKQYFYPDSPKNYQISQYDQPICLGGSVEIELPGAARNVMGEHKIIPLTRIHLEEDVGKLNHTASDSLVDYNRAGTPLMEIVSEPAMHTAEEAFAYLTSIRNTMIYGGISDCDMEKGQLRCDANISIRPVGEKKLGTKVELKNLNSISYVRDGIAHEIKNPLTPIKLSVQQLLRVYDPNDPSSKSKIELIVHAIIEQIDGLVKIANDFSLFAQLPAPYKKETDLVLLIKNVLPMFSSYGNMQITLESQEPKLMVNLDKDQWVQVFNNLLKNATQACSETVNPRITVYLTQTENGLKIEIKDNGCGIAKEEMDKIFTPHFTTKSTGSGIGLSLVKQIVENHGGSITFISKQNKGTTFTIFLS